MCLTGLNLTLYCMLGQLHGKHFFFSPLNIIIFSYRDYTVCSLVQHMWAPLNQRDLTMRWQICIAWIQSGSFGSVVAVLDPVIKPNAFTYSANAPVQCNVHPYIGSSFQKHQVICLGHLTLTGSMKKSLSPWPEAINSISHSSLCLSFLSFSRQIHLHERPLTLAWACRWMAI